MFFNDCRALPGYLFLLPKSTRMKTLLFAWLFVAYAIAGNAQLKTNSNTPAQKTAIVSKSIVPVKAMDSSIIKKLMTIDTKMPVKVLEPLKGKIPFPKTLTAAKQTTTPSQPAATSTPASGQVSTGSAANTCRWPNLPNQNYMGEYGTGLMTCYNAYYLTGVSVKIYTGNDNKEYPSSMEADVYLPFGSDYGNAQNSSTLLYTNTMSGDNGRKSEFKSNSITPINLTAVYSIFDGQGSLEYHPNEMSLAKIANSGLVIVIYYTPNLLTDAWKIEKAEVTFNVTKPAGDPHPQYNNKTITFTKSKLLTNGVNDCLVMRVDGSLNPGLAY